MKKKAKIILASATICSVIPAVSVLSSCTTVSHNKDSVAIYNADFATVLGYQPDTITNWTEYYNAVINSDQGALLSTCSAFKILVPNTYKIYAYDMKDNDNIASFFMVMYDPVGYNEGLLNNVFQVNINNINPNLSVHFKQPLAENNVLNQIDTNQKAGNAFDIDDIEPNLVSIADNSNVYKPNTNFVSDSNLVVNYLNNYFTYNSIDPNTFTQDKLETELLFFAKQLIQYNIDKWKANKIELANFRINICHQFNKSNNQHILGLQMFNPTNSNQVFEFNCFDKPITLSLNPNDYVSAKFVIDTNQIQNKLTVNFDSDLTFVFNRTNFSYAKNNDSAIIVDNQNLQLYKSIELNTNLVNVVYKNKTMFDNQNIQIFNDKLNSLNLTVQDLKTNLLNKVKERFDYFKKQALLNLEVIKYFALPSFMDEVSLKQYDLDHNGIYSLVDVLYNLSTPLSELLKLDHNDDLAIIVKNFLSAQSIYETFYNSFDAILALLRSLKTTFTNSLATFLEQNLTANGQKKTLAEFKDFFANVNNLKEVLGPLFANGGVINGYTAELIYQLLDDLSVNYNKPFLQWLFDNFKKIATLASRFIKPNNNAILEKILKILTAIPKINVLYNNQPVNIMSELPLYDLFSRENITVQNADKESFKLINNLISTINSFLKIKLPLIVEFAKFIIHSLSSIGAGETVKITVQQYKEIFKSFFIPTKIDNKPNSNNINIIEALNTPDSYTIIKQANNADFFIDLTNNNTNPENYIANLEFQLILPNISTKVYNPNKKNFTDFNLATLNYNYYINNNNTISKVLSNPDNTLKYEYTTPALVFNDIKSNTYSTFCLDKWDNQLQFIDSGILLDLNLNKTNSFVQNKNVIDDRLKFDTSLFKLTLKNADLIKLIKHPNLLLLNNVDYLSAINSLTSTNVDLNKLNLNNNTLRPVIYIEKSKTLLGKDKYSIVYNFDYQVLQVSGNKSTLTKQIKLPITLSK